MVVSLSNTKEPLYLGWDDRGVGFPIGIDAMPNLRGIADVQEQSTWQPAARPPHYQVATTERPNRKT